MIDSTLTNHNNNNRDVESIKSKLYVKYMVCLRDELSVQSVLNKQELNYRISVHGAIEILEDITEDRYYELKMSLANSGFILLDKKESMLIDRIIHIIVELVHYSDALPKMNFGDLINKYVISGDETILKIFSDVKGISVLQYIVIQKIERAKEMLLYEDMPLDEIAKLLNYKNQDYLIAQFKKITGLTPTYFKRLKKERMKIVEKYNNESQSGTAETGS